MTLAAGTRLGPYEIVSAIGAGGMGEVYRARDTRLGRDVAVKVLPQTLAFSEELRQRFEREARAIAQVSHPHICALHDVGREGTTEYLVMELLEGETLAQRLTKGPLPLDQTLRFGSEIASALDAAHRKGIVHRDLKPGNVMVTASGVKLLDFGLAKVLSPAGPVESLTSAPTAARDVTREGAILGTLSYMAPEQLEGKPADARADIFALGTVLYEMATGRKAFTGTSQASLISAILTTEPAAISSIQTMSPPALDRLVRVCLAKDPAGRWQSAHDVALLLQAIADRETGEPSRKAGSRGARAAWVPWLLAAAAATVAAVVIVRGRAPGKAVPGAIRFTVSPPQAATFSYSVEAPFLSVSPDGSQIAYIASDTEGRKIHVRPLSGLEAQAIQGTEGARSLFWSPDGRSIAFFGKDKLRRVDLSGGAPVSICDVPPGIGISGTWGSAGDILFASVQGEAIYRVPAAGGAPVSILHPDISRGEGRFSWPFFLPDGKHFLYLARNLGASTNLMWSAPGEPSSTVMPLSSQAQYADPGVLVFAREGALLGQRFDPERGRVLGEPFSLAPTVRHFPASGAAAFAVSRKGTIAFQSQGDVMRLTWFDRTGRRLGTVGPPGEYLNVAISRDGGRALFDRVRAGLGTYGIWSIDLERGAETPITPGPDTEIGAVMLPGEKSLAYSAVRGRSPQLYRHDLATGKDEELIPGGRFQLAQDVSPDGKTLLYTERGESGVFDLWGLPLSAGGKPVALLESPFSKSEPRFSPDGRFIAMISGESGLPEVYVIPYPGPGERVRASNGGAQHVRWSRDGREIFYISRDQVLMSIPVRTTPSLQLGAATALVTLKGGTPIGLANGVSSGFDVMPDGKRFLVVVPEVVADALPLSVVVNGMPEAKR